MPKPTPYQNDELLVKFLLGEASENEVIEASNWISLSPENEAYFQHLMQVWKDSKSSRKHPNIDENKAWERFQQRINPTVTTVQRAANFHFWKNNLFRVAASILLVIGTITVAFLAYREFSESPQIELLTTAESRSQELPDGSEIILNKNSSIQYPVRFTGNERIVSLHGEGFFTIKPNSKKPFLIKVNSLIVKVVGTSFNIREATGKTEIIVETGIVQVIGHGKMTELHPTEKLIVRTGDSLLQKEKQTDQLYNYYRSKSFTCDNTPLWKLVEVLNEAYDVNIEIANPSNRNLLLTTTFEDESLDKILSIIGETLDINVEKTSTKIILQ